MDDPKTPPASVEPPPSSEEARELFIARHFPWLMAGAVASAVALVVWFVRGCG